MALTKEDIINAVADMTVMEVVELIEAMEEKFGVSAAAAVAAVPAAGGEAGGGAVVPGHRRALGLVADPFQVGDRLDDGHHEAEVGRGRLPERDDTDALLVDRHLDLVDEPRQDAHADQHVQHAHRHADDGEVRQRPSQQVSQA